MRLDQWLSKALFISRSDAKKLIKYEAVTEVNGTVLRNPSTRINESQTLLVDDEEVSLAKAAYWLLHKPANTVCSHDDDGYPSVLKLLPQHPDKLHFAGRLDADSTGLVLVSSDGQWTHRVSHPKHHHAKVYLVDLADELSAQAIEELEQGVLLRGEDKPTLPSKIELLSSKQCKITITEGKYHQVKRMFAAVGNKVIGLHRLAIGSIHLGDLTSGEYRELSPEEVQYFYD